MDNDTLESGAQAPAEGITISGERTEGASGAAFCGAMVPVWSIQASGSNRNEGPR